MVTARIAAESYEVKTKDERKMKQIKRRYEAGKMLMDVTKYLLTIGIIGGIITNKITTFSAVFTVVAVILLFSVAYFTIPPDKEEQS